MKLTPKFVVCIWLILFILLFLPYGVPALNVTTPIFGMPFIAFWDLGLLILFSVLSLIASFFVWDPFDNYQDAPDEEEITQGEVEKV